MAEIVLSWADDPQDVISAKEKILGVSKMPFPGEDRRGYIAHEVRTGQIAGVMVMEMAGGGITSMPEVLFAEVDPAEEATSDVRYEVMSAFVLEVSQIAEAYGMKPDTIPWPEDRA